MPAIDIDDYRKRYEKALKDAAPVAKRAAKKRAFAAAAAPAGPAADDVGAQATHLLAVAADRKAKIADRLDALQDLSALEFLGDRFAPHRADWVSCLRTLATDPSAKIRRNALEQLALRQDARGRELLLNGLEKPAEALVPDVLALQYLGHDGHGDAVPVAKKVYRRATGAAREEALRILGNDPDSAPLLERLMKDKDEKSSVRRISAAALQDLDPERFEKAARRVVADDDDFNEIRSTSLTALALKSGGSATGDAKLVQAVSDLHGSSRSPVVKASASRFLGAAARERGDT